MTLPEQVAKALPIGVQKALEDLMLAAAEAQAECIAAKGRERPLPQETAECLWVKSDGKTTYIGDMHDHHVRNALSKIVRLLREDKVAFIGADGKLQFADRLKHVKDGSEVFVDEGGDINEFEEQSKY